MSSRLSRKDLRADQQQALIEALWIPDCTREWEGTGEEMWILDHSSLLQLQVDIQKVRQTYRRNRKLFSVSWNSFQYIYLVNSLSNKIINYLWFILSFYWGMTMMILLLINMIILPITISFFNDDLSPRWIVFNCVYDTIFLLDIVVNFRTGTV